MAASLQSSIRVLLRVALATGLAAITGCASSHGAPPAAASSGSAAPAIGTPRVGPERGAVVVVGGGSQGPEIFAKFIELAGGPDALIIDVPTAGGDSLYPADGGRGLRAAGARNVFVLHTKDRRIADSDSFVARIAEARGIWFGGGRHYHLVDSYLGTKTQRAFEAVLERGGVIGGSSAGASILGSYLVRGAPSSNNRIISHPDYLTGFGYLRGTAVDQHVVARDRLADLHDSLTSTNPALLGISVDEGTAWIIRGDAGEVVGRGKAFVYNSRDANDLGKPFLTLRPGDRYNLGARRVLERAIDATSLTQAFVDSLLSGYREAGSGGATLLVAQAGKVLVNTAYGIPVQRRYLPETSAPNFPLLDLSELLNASLPDADSERHYGAAAARRVLAIGGLQRSQLDSLTGRWHSNVDDLYRWELGRTTGRDAVLDPIGVTRGLAADTYRGETRLSAYGNAKGMRHAYVRFPARRTVIIVLTNDDAAPAGRLAERIADRLLFSGSR
jgi:cyanophycinase